MANLRSVLHSDLPDLHRWSNSQDATGPFDEASLASLEKIQGIFNRGGYKTTWLIEHEGRSIGYANFVVHPWDDWIACIGVVICKPEFRGKGLGTEVHKTLAKLIFAKLPEIHKLEAFTDTENLAETKALEKAEFYLEGTQKRKNKLRGEFRDMHVFACLRP